MQATLGTITIMCKFGGDPTSHLPARISDFREITNMAKRKNFAILENFKI